MALDTFTALAPNQRNQTTNPTGDDLELVIEEFSGMVEGTLQRKSVLSGWIPMRTLKGTATLTNYSVGETKLGKIERGVTPAASAADFSKIGVTIDTPILARNTIMILDDFQTSFDARKEIAGEQGKKLGKFIDEALFIQALKSSMLTSSPYGSAGHQGGTQQIVTDRADPAALFASLSTLLGKMEKKDVVVDQDDLMLAVPPDVFFALSQSEMLVSTEYVTSEGNKIQNGIVLKAYGLPVVRSNNIPQSVISGHELSNTRNSNAFDGDFSKVVGCVFSPRALLAGQNIPLQSNVHFHDKDKHWYIDSWLAFSATPNRPEFAGLLTLA